MKRLLSLLLAAMMILSLVACGGSSGGDTASGSGTTDSGTNTSTPAPSTGGDTDTTADTSGAKAPDNDFVIAIPNDATHLDPHVSSNGYSNQITNAMYECLLAFNEDTEIVPMLATEWSVSDDALVYTFKLRDDVTFHDGEKFNAEAVRANWQRGITDTSLSLNRNVKSWTDVEILGEYEVAIHLESPNNTFINKLTQVRMVSPAVIAMDNPSDYLAKNSAGTGPFKLSDRVDGGYTKMVPYENYWREGPTVDSLTFQVVPEDASRLAMLQTGEADLIYPVPVTDISQIENDPNIIVDVRDTTIFRYVTLNTEWSLPDGRKPFADKRVRQALNYAFDSEAYAKVVFNGYAKEPTSCFADTILYHSPNTPYKADIEKAKELMKEAGFEDGFDVEIIVDNTTIEQKGATFVMQQLSQIGVNVKLLPNESTVNAEATSAPLETTTVQMWYVNWSSGSFEADGSMRSILHSTKFPPDGYNTAFWNNAEFDKLLDDALLMSDTNEIAETYAKAQAVVWEECPWMFLGNDNAIVAYKPYCTGLQFKPGDEVVVTTIGLDH